MFRNKRLMWALGMALVPLLGGILLCLAYGKDIFQVYLPASVWNDELFYYKQVEAVLNCGFPQGFFGFNESHAQYLSFAAWSPVVLIPYLLWGLVFGWNLMSPIFCNILLSMAAVFLFVYLTKSNWKQCIALGIMYLGSLFTTRYMLSGMSETICIFWAVLYLGLCINYREAQKRYKLVLLFAVVGIMALIRPYYLIFILLPAFFAIRKYRWRAAALSLAAIAGIGVLYVFISGRFCADYFTDLFSVVWLENYKITGLLGGIRDTFLILIQRSKEFIKMGLGDLRGSAEAVGLIGQFSLIVLALLYQTIAEGVKKKKEKAVWYGYFAASLLVILTAFFLMYHMLAGSRHLLVFITMGIFLISRAETKYFVKPAFLSGALLFFFLQVPAESEQKKLYFKEPAIEDEYLVWEEIMDSGIVFNKENVPNWDNVVIWAMSDVTEGEAHLEHTITKWQLLYALPEGTGINCCLQSYILNSFDSLQSKYLAVVPGGEIERLCEAKGKTEIGRTENLVLYALH